jgi:hypothetical protein
LRQSKDFLLFQGNPQNENPSQTFKRHGTFYIEIKRPVNIVLFALRYYPVGSIIGFDVCRLSVRPSRILNRKTMPRGETYPKNAAYGNTSWSFCLKVTALAKFNEQVVLHGK